MLSHFLLAVPPAEGNTRMMEQQNLSVSCAKPEAGLPESKCSHSLCPPHLLRRARPNDGTAEPVSFVHEAGSRSGREQMLSPAEGDTRMMEQQNLSVLIAMPPVGLSESTCSHSLCPPHLLRRAYPNDRIAKSVSFAREAGSRPAREHMPAHICPSRANLLPTLSPIIPQ